MSIRTLFWNDAQNRLRLLWRIVGVTFFAMLGILLLSLGIAINSLISGSVPDPFSAEGMLISSFISLVVVAIATVLAARFLDKRPFADYGFHLNRAWWLDLGFGLFLGGLLMTAIFLVELAAGWVTITDTFVVSHAGWPFAFDLLFPLITFICVGVYEELVSRGYLLQNLAEGLNLKAVGAIPALLIAWFISSALFGIGHIVNPNTSIISSINLILAGIFLGLAYVLTGELAIPIGLHTTWNFFQGNVYGFPVSGIDVAMASFLEIEQAGPELWTGGAFGPEAGLVGVVAILTGCALIVAWVRLRSGAISLYTPLAHYAQPQETPEHQTGASGR